MALKIRLRQQGRNNRQTFRVVVADIRAPRDGRYLEMLGWYNPFQAENNVMINAERISHWLSLGAEVSHQVETLMSQKTPEVLKALREKRHAKAQKRAAKRRALRAS